MPDVTPFLVGKGNPISWEGLCSLEGVLMNFYLWVLTCGEVQNANSATEKCKWSTCLLSRAYPTKCLVGCGFEGDGWSVGTSPSLLSDSSCPLDHSGDEILTVASENVCFYGVDLPSFICSLKGVSGSSSFSSVCSNWAHSSVHRVYFQFLSPKGWEPGRSCCPRRAHPALLSPGCPFWYVARGSQGAGMLACSSSHCHCKRYTYWPAEVSPMSNILTISACWWHQEMSVNISLLAKRFFKKSPP